MELVCRRNSELKHTEYEKREILHPSIFRFWEEKEMNNQKIFLSLIPEGRSGLCLWINCFGFANFAVFGFREKEMALGSSAGVAKGFDQGFRKLLVVFSKS